MMIEPTYKIIAAAGGAGLIGTVLRLLMVRAVDKLLPGFPWGTLAVNVAGAFLAGFCFVFCRAKWPHYEAYFPVLFVGFFGAFTTFSTFALESARLFAGGAYLKAGANVLLQNGVGLTAALAGLYLAKRLCA